VVHRGGVGLLVHVKLCYNTCMAVSSAYMGVTRMDDTKKVIDVYFYGINGFTYSYTYPDMVSATGVEDVKDIIDMDDEGTHDLYVTRHMDISKEDFPPAKGMHSVEAEQFLNNANLTI